jgi:hypothetical protein
MKMHYRKETEYTGIPNWWLGTKSIDYRLMTTESARLRDLYPSIWVSIHELVGESLTYNIRILFNKEEDEALFIIRESL